MVQYKSGTPVDHTNGAGVFPASGSIILTKDLDRNWLYIQNQDIGTITITYVSQNASDAAAGTVAEYLAGTDTSGAQGGSNERLLTHSVPFNLFIREQIIITGTAGKKVLVTSGY